MATVVILRRDLVQDPSLNPLPPTDIPVNLLGLPSNPTVFSVTVPTLESHLDRDEVEMVMMI